MAQNAWTQAVVTLGLFCLTVIPYAAEKASGEPIRCVQCTPEHPRCESGNPEPTECEDRHSYCGMYRVFMGETQGVFRGCSRHWLRGCRRKMIETQESMVCYHTCSWDGCNQAYGSMMSYLL